MPSTARSAACLALLLGLAGGLSACGGSAEPSTMPSSSGSTTPSASPTGPVEPVLPEAAKANTKAGAVAFVKHYVALLNYAQSTGKVDPARSATASDCAECQAVLNDVAHVYADGGSISGGSWKITRTLTDRNTDPRFSGWFVLVRVRSGAQTVTRPNAPSQHFKAGASSHEFLVARIQDGWKVARWTHVG